jgi:N-acetylglucosamine malate deacetylase 1
MKRGRKSQPDSLLAFGAHPDDVEFGCGGVVAAHTAAGARAHLVVCSRGEAASHGTPRQREREATKSAAILGATLEFVTLDGDAHLECRVAHAIELAAVLRRVRPRVVLAPSMAENQHPDHAKLGRLVRDACRLARYGGLRELKKRPPHAIAQLFFYALTSDSEPEDNTSVLIDVSNVIGPWTAAMRAHGSQLQDRDYVELQLARARLHGLRAGVAHAIALFPGDPLLFDWHERPRRSARRF